MIHEFPTVIYPYRIWILIDKSPELIGEIFIGYESGEDIIFKEEEKALASTYKVVNKKTAYCGSVLYFSKKSAKMPDVVAHEAVHAAKQCFEHINANAHPHEPLEYLVGYIVRCVNETRKYKEEKVKKKK